MLTRTAITTIPLLLGTFVFRAGASDLTQLALERRFTGTVHPFLETYCFSCHGPEKQKGKLDLSRYVKMESVTLDYPLWEIVLQKLKAEEMPPEEAKRQPTAELRRGVIDWIQALRKHEARQNAGDPGPVPARRLSNAEYDYTIRDLTGVDLRPAREFPVDPANEAGFDNSGESLIMSPVLLKKYLDAARRVAEHLVLKPAGFVFAPHPAVTETDRDKYCVKRIVDFYQRQPTNYADYFMAAWRFRHHAALQKPLDSEGRVPRGPNHPLAIGENKMGTRGIRPSIIHGPQASQELDVQALHQPEASLAAFAAEANISSKYLATIWSLLEGRKEEIGPIAALQAMWRELPAPNGNREDAARRGCERMRDFVVSLRQKLTPEFKNLTLRGIAAGSQPLVLWKDRQSATNRLRYSVGTWQTNSDPKLEGHPALDAIAGQVLAMSTDKTARERYEPAFARFCRVFPDAFFVSERGRVFLEEEKENRGRLLSAGFHLMTGYFRDDEPLCQLILDEREQRELDTLWQELNFIAFAPMRQYKDFIFFERAEPPRFMQDAEFDFARSEDKDATSEAKIRQLAAAYLAKARRNASNGPAIQAIEHYFKSISTDIRWVEQARLAAEPSHLMALQAFAERAYRRPLSQTERDDL
ncbi:MAG TPA: DUF1587 domain-containing protein, partial [Verrucomicrobiae bacterium]